MDLPNWISEITSFPSVIDKACNNLCMAEVGTEFSSTAPVAPGTDRSSFPSFIRFFRNSNTVTRSEPATQRRTCPDTIIRPILLDIYLNYAIDITKRRMMHDLEFNCDYFSFLFSHFPTRNGKVFLFYFLSSTNSKYFVFRFIRAASFMKHSFLWMNVFALIICLINVVKHSELQAAESFFKRSLRVRVYLGAAL